MLGIMTMIIQKGKDASIKVQLEATEAPETSHPKIMVSITKYQLIEKPDKAVF
jgi:hypothetical protein